MAPTYENIKYYSHGITGIDSGAAWIDPGAARIHCGAARIDSGGTKTDSCASGSPQVPPELILAHTKVDSGSTRNRIKWYRSRRFWKAYNRQARQHTRIAATKCSIIRSWSDLSGLGGCAPGCSPEAPKSDPPAVQNPPPPNPNIEKP